MHFITNLKKDALLSESSEALRMMQRFESEIQYAPFRQLPPAVLAFLITDTACMPVDPESLQLIPETRLIIDDAGEVISGDLIISDIPLDKYHPYRLEVFQLRGFWIEENELETFSAASNVGRIPLSRCKEGTNEVLFLLHPASEAIYAPLINRYAAAEIRAPALILSSCRTLLIALPDDHGSSHQYVMAKLSLDAVLAGSKRILKKKDCIVAVANTVALHGKNPDTNHGGKRFDMEFMQEKMSIVPPCALLSQATPPDDLAESAGLIFRPIPPWMLEADCTFRIVPFFALHGVKNAPLLNVMMSRSGRAPVDFISQNILTPLAAMYVDMLYHDNISIEAHGQNLLIKLDGDLQPTGFIYRDMGGVNYFLDNESLNRLQQPLAQEKNFYFNTHFLNAADSLENHVAGKLLFNLTKQFVKVDFNDPVFSEWKKRMSEGGFLANWTTGNDTDDLHTFHLRVNEYYRYGFFEIAFAEILLGELERHGVFNAINTVVNQLYDGTLDAERITTRLRELGLKDDTLPDWPKDGVDATFFKNLLHTPAAGFVSPCIGREWFKELVLLTYPLFYVYKNSPLFATT